MFNIAVETRNVFGKKLKESRKEGKIPAILYGKGKKNTPLFVDLKEFKKIWKEAEESTVVKLKKLSEPNFSESAFIYGVDIDPLKREPSHIDFYVPEAGKSIATEVAIVFEGVAPAVKEQGGVLVKVIHKLEIEALPENFPHEIKIDVSKLAGIGDKILVKDISAPAGVKILAKGDSVVVLAKPRTEEKEETPMTIEDIEVEKKGKKEETVEESEEATQQPKQQSKSVK